MGLFDSVKRNLNIGGPKLKVDQDYLRAGLSDRFVEVGFTITNQSTPVHVDKISLMLYSEVPGNDNQHVFYKQTVYENEGRGWDLGADQTQRFSLPAMLNEPDLGIDVVSLFRNRSRYHPISGSDPFWRLQIQVVADLPKVLNDPQDTVILRIYA